MYDKIMNGIAVGVVITVWFCLLMLLLFGVYNFIMYTFVMDLTYSVIFTILSAFTLVGWAFHRLTREEVDENNN